MRSPAFALRAVPGPRIRPHGVTPGIAANPRDRPASVHVLPSALQPQELLQSWPLRVPRGQGELFGWLSVLALGLLLGLALPGGPWARALGLGLCAWALYRLPGSRSRRLRQEQERLEAALGQGAPPAELYARCEDILALDADQPAARLLLATLMFEEDQPLACLLQLAPLRDSHPDQGEVVVLGALAWLRLGRRREAAQLLAALVEPQDPAIRLWLDELKRSAGLGDDLLRDGS